MKSITYRGIVFYNPDYEDIYNNRARTNRAILCGRLKHKPCEICGHEISVAHHEKYSDFLNVRWLCYSDHKVIHSLFRKVKYNELNIEYCHNELIKHPDYLWYKSDIDRLEKEQLKYNIK